MEEDYQSALKQLTALLDGETDTICMLANTSAFINEVVNDINWAGFYLYDKNINQLKLGPFQGKVACTRIPMNKGVCGTSAYKKETLRIENVHEFDGHIACDSASNAEIVIPILKDNSIYGVLDLDSTTYNRFTEQDQLFLENIVKILEEKL